MKYQKSNKEIDKVFLHIVNGILRNPISFIEDTNNFFNTFWYPINYYNAKRCHYPVQRGLELETLFTDNIFEYSKLFKKCLRNIRIGYSRNFHTILLKRSYNYRLKYLFYKCLSFCKNKTNCIIKPDSASCKQNSLSDKLNSFDENSKNILKNDTFAANFISDIFQINMDFTRTTSTIGTIFSGDNLILYDNYNFSSNKYRKHIILRPLQNQHFK